MTLALIFLLAAVYRYLAVDATITRFLWTRYPDWLDAFLSCSACSGFWFSGATATYFTIVHDWRMTGLTSWEAPIVCAFLGIFTTPILTALHFLTLQYLADQGMPREVRNGEDDDDGV